MRSASVLLLAFATGLLAQGRLAPLGPIRPPVERAVRFEFALIGDTPYDEHQATNDFPNLVEELNKTRLAFVIHDGDIKSSSSPCTDDLFEERYRLFQTVRHPFIYILGDNEWTDCLRATSRPFDPLERLEKLRAIFAQGERSLGQRALPLTRQSQGAEFAEFRENVRWTYGGVLFAGLNIPGDANDFGAVEYERRNEANLAWLRGAFAQAARENRRALMIVMQANPHFELASTNRLRLGFNSLLQMLEAETIAFKKPVALVHGDSHYFRIDQPLFGSHSHRRLENFTRVETFGSPDVHWVRVRVDPRDPHVFEYRPEHVRKNLQRHSL